MLLRQGAKAALLHRQKQTQGSCQIEETKSNGPEKDQNKTAEKELSEMEIANLLDAEFKMLVIRMLRELLELCYGNNIEEEMKVTLSEIKNNPQETNREGKEADTQTNGLEHKEEINNQPEQKEEIRIKKK